MLVGSSGECPLLQQIEDIFATAANFHFPSIIVASLGDPKGR
jgi:hypothetical protein